jgi:hypothetical protein
MAAPQIRLDDDALSSGNGTKLHLDILEKFKRSILLFGNLTDALRIMWKMTAYP